MEPTINERLRIQALELAVAYITPAEHATSKTVVAVAGQFYKFLKEGTT